MTDVNRLPPTLAIHPENEGICYSCVHFRVPEGHPRDLTVRAPRSLEGPCQKNSPRGRRVGSGEKFRAEWPVVPARESCGQYERVTGKEPRR